MKPFAKILITLAFWTNFSFAGENETLVQVASKDAENYWVIKKVTRPSYPRVAALEGVEGCAAIGFIIESNGSTSSLRPLAGYPSEVFLRPALDAIKKWRFEPSKSNVSKQPIFTYQIVGFSLGSSTREKEVERQIIRNSCETAANKSFNRTRESTAARFRGTAGGRAG